MVLRGLHNVYVPAVDEGQYRGLLAEKLILDDELIARRAEYPITHYFFSGEDTVRRVVADKNALAFGQSRRLDYHGLISGCYVCLGVAEPLEDSGLGGGYGTGTH